MTHSSFKFAAAMALTILAGASSAQPNARLDARIADGSATRDEQARYIHSCVADAACNAALMQIWQTNGKEVSMDRYLPPEDKIPPMLRGTDMGRKMSQMGAINRCAPDDRCRAFLVEATSTIRSVPADSLPPVQQAQGRAAQMNQQAALQQQIQARVAQMMAQGGAMQQNQQNYQAPAQDNDAPGVVDFARDPFTGVTMQMVKQANGNREIQRRTADGVKTLATVLGREGKWLIQIAGGGELEASDIQLTSRGFLAGVQGQPVSYTEAAGLQKLQWPQGFHPASIQRGSVARTGYLLLERNQAQRGTAASVLNSFKGLGATLGAGRNEDYALFDLHSGRSFPINSNASGKEVMQMSNCQRKNALTNVCRDATSSEKLYNSMGKNMGHYAWTINWFHAPSGTYLVALEDGVRNLTVTKLDTGEKRVAFNRTLGIADFAVEQTEEGKIRLSAKMAFAVQTIDDLEAAFSRLPAAAASPAQAMAGK